MSDEARTLYVGNLNLSVSEPFMTFLFSQMGQVLSCKMIYEPGQDPYCFIEFADHQSASSALATMNGREVMGKAMKVNWATSPNSKNASESKRVDTSEHFHIFVGDLSPDIETKQLKEAFSAFGEISDCKVIADMATGKSKGYGFISFVNKEDAQKAISEMNGAWLGSRAIRTNWATRKPPAPVERVKQTKNKLSYDEIYGQASETNSTVYIGGIQQGLNDDLLRDVFSQYGQVAEIRCFTDKGYAFVRLDSKAAAAQAIVGLSGSEVGGFVCKCSWGKESNDMKPMGTAQPGFAGYQQNYGSNWGNGYMYGGQQWGGQQWGGQQWGDGQQQQWGGQWGGGDPSSWQQQPQQGYGYQQQQQQQQQGYGDYNNYNYGNSGGY